MDFKEIALLVGLLLLVVGVTYQLEKIRGEKAAALPERRSIPLPPIAQFTMTPTIDTIYTQFKANQAGACLPSQNLSISADCKTKVNDLLAKWTSGGFASNKNTLESLGYQQTLVDAISIVSGIASADSVSRTLQGITSVPVGVCPVTFMALQEGVSLDVCKRFCTKQSFAGWMSYDPTRPKQQCRCYVNEPSNTQSTTSGLCLARGPLDEED